MKKLLSQWSARAFWFWRDAEAGRRWFLLLRTVTKEIPVQRR